MRIRYWSSDVCSSDLATLRIQVGIINRTIHRISSTGTYLWEPRRGRIGIPDISRLRRRKYFQPGIIGRIIQWVFRVKCISRLSGRIVKLTISIVISDKQRPSEKPRLAGLIHLIVAPRATGSPAIVVCIRTDIAPIKVAVSLIDRNPIRIAIAHHIYFRTCIRRSLRKQVTLRYAIAAIRQYADTKDLATKIIGIDRGASGIVLLITRPAIQRCKPVVFERGGFRLVKRSGIVASRKIQ